jgi:hypothetical protein
MAAFTCVAIAIAMLANPENGFGKGNKKVGIQLLGKDAVRENPKHRSNVWPHGYKAFELVQWGANEGV